MEKELEKNKLFCDYHKNNIYLWLKHYEELYNYAIKHKEISLEQCNYYGDMMYYYLDLYNKF